MQAVTFLTAITLGVYLLGKLMKINWNGEPIITSFETISLLPVGQALSNYERALALTLNVFIRPDDREKYAAVARRSLDRYLTILDNDPRLRAMQADRTGMEYDNRRK